MGVSETRTFSLANGHVHSKHTDKTHCFWGTEAWRSGALHQLQSEAGPVQWFSPTETNGTIWIHMIPWNHFRNSQKRCYVRQQSMTIHEWLSMNVIRMFIHIRDNPKPTCSRAAKKKLGAWIPSKYRCEILTFWYVLSPLEKKNRFCGLGHEFKFLRNPYICIVLAETCGNYVLSKQQGSNQESRMARCHIMSHHVTSCHIMSHHVTSCHIMSHHVTSCHIMSHHVTSCHIQHQNRCLSYARPLG